MRNPWAPMSKTVPDYNHVRQVGWENDGSFWNFFQGRGIGFNLILRKRKEDRRQSEVATI